MLIGRRANPLTSHQFLIGFRAHTGAKPRRQWLQLSKVGGRQGWMGEVKMMEAREERQRVSQGRSKKDTITFKEF